jgi:hypothetical protein
MPRPPGKKQTAAVNRTAHLSRWTLISLEFLQVNLKPRLLQYLPLNGPSVVIFFKSAVDETVSSSRKI